MTTKNQKGMVLGTMMINEYDPSPGYGGLGYECEAAPNCENEAIEMVKLPYHQGCCGVCQRHLEEYEQAMEPSDYMDDSYTYRSM